MPLTTTTQSRKSPRSRKSTRSKKGAVRIAAVVGALALAGTVAAVPLSASATGSSGLKATGLASNGTALVRFHVNRPWAVSGSDRVRGLSGDQRLVGIDYRVQNSRLYGVGDKGGVYLIGSGASGTKVGQLSVALAGAKFGVDFNPAANALRIVSDTGQNLRQPFAANGDGLNGATVADTGLTNAGVAATGVSAAAYTNNDLNASTGTTLFDVDTALDQVSIQAPANNGLLSATGKLGVNAGADAGFDIYSSLRNGKAAANKGYATLSVDGRYRLYQVDLLTGAVERKGSFGSAVTDIAIPLNQR